MKLHIKRGWAMTIWAPVSQSPACSSARAQAHSTQQPRLQPAVTTACLQSLHP